MVSHEIHETQLTGFGGQEGIEFVVTILRLVNAARAKRGRRQDPPDVCFQKRHQGIVRALESKRARYLGGVFKA